MVRVGARRYGARTCCWPEREGPHGREQSAGVGGLRLSAPFPGALRVRWSKPGWECVHQRGADGRQCRENQGRRAVFQIKGDERGHRVLDWTLGRGRKVGRASRGRQSVCGDSGSGDPRWDVELVRLVRERPCFSKCGLPAT